MTTQQAELMIGARLEPVKVTRQEELQFGVSYAPMMRRMGRAATELEQTLFQAEVLCAESREADSITAGLTNPPAMDEQGRTPHGAWVEGVASRLGEARNTLNILLAEIGMECIQRERRDRTALPDDDVRGYVA